jgi:hypothetical protein
VYASQYFPIGADDGSNNQECMVFFKSVLQCIPLQHHLVPPNSSTVRPHSSFTDLIVLEQTNVLTEL